MLVIPVDSNFLSAVLSECRSCLCFFSGVVSLISSQNHIPFRRSFSCNRQNKKPIHRDIKNWREHCSRFKMMFYVTALKFKDGTVCSSIHSLTVPKSIECRWRYFLLAYRRHWAVLHRIPNRNILYLVVALFREKLLYQNPRRKSSFFSEGLYRFCKGGVY